MKIVRRGLRRWLGSRSLLASVFVVLVFGWRFAPEAAAIGAEATAALDRTATGQGICVVLGLPKADRPDFVTELAKRSELLVYFQSPSADEVAGVRRAAESAGLLGKRIFADQGSYNSVHLADNLAGAILVAPSAKAAVSQKELLRVLHPEGKAFLGEEEIVKPFPEGVDDWSHPYHAADNNPFSTDQVARAPYITQFLAEPMFSTFPAVTVTAGGRIFRAFGHHATHANQNAVLNTLQCVNAYNGTVLWKRALREGFTIHRSTMIATPQTLYLADDQSCKLIDARPGKVKSQIVIPAGISDGPVWKWMALEDGVLYALVGGQEVKAETQRSANDTLGGWPVPVQEKSHENYNDPKTSPGFGRTLAAINEGNGEILWSHREDEYIDSRGVCMKNGRIYFYSPQEFLGCLDAKAGKVLWKTSDPDLLKSIGSPQRGKTRSFFAETSYAKCNDKVVLFTKCVPPMTAAVSVNNGKMLWQKDVHLHLVLREDALYATSWTGNSLKVEYETGKELSSFPKQWACARATGSVDSILYRSSGGGTARLDIASGFVEHIAPVRPPCIDGVIISNGLLYWGPWMCRCRLSLYGHVCLGPAGQLNVRPTSPDSRLTPGRGDTVAVEQLEAKPGDWPCDGGDNARTSVTKVAIPRKVNRQWVYRMPCAARPTAPVVVGGIAYVGDHTGAVRALDAAKGTLRWQAHTGGAIFSAPAVWRGRVYVGSADGRVYAFEAGTGRPLWNFRVAPGQRWIPVYGNLISTWPVAGGVVVQNGVVYAAAGIAHYDGTYVVALDAVTGKVKWCNDSSGKLSKETNSGISLQGNLFVRDGELRFLGGNVHETARYDLETGKCLNEPYDQVGTRFRTAFCPYYPQYGQYAGLHHTFADGRTLDYAVNHAAYQGDWHLPLRLLAPLTSGTTTRNKEVTRQPRAGARARQREIIWQDKSECRFNSFVLAPNVLIVAGHKGPDNIDSPFLAAINVQDGSDIWRSQLPHAAVKGGTAVDHQGRIIVSLDGGEVHCFAPVVESRFVTEELPRRKGRR